MKVADAQICPFCGEPIPEIAIRCNFCENDLRSEYSIVPDGLNFGIAFGEENRKLERTHRSKADP